MSIAKFYVMDVAVLDRENIPFAFVEVKERPPETDWATNWANLISRTLHRDDSLQVEFLITVDLSKTQIYPIKDSGLDKPVILDTSEVLSAYDPEFSGKRIYKEYLRTLVEAWLRDLAYQWKSANPPGTEELKSTGFLERIEGGTTHAQWEERL